MLLINNLQFKFAQHRSLIDAALARVIDRGWVVLGPEVKNFEAAFARYLGVSHCIGLANGTDAIELALRAMGVSAGDKVATVANAGMYTTTALLAIGAVPHFMDVDARTQHATLAEVVGATQAGCRAVAITHLYGVAVKDTVAIASHCAEHGVALLEDCAQAHGARIDGRQVGSFGDAASFSFYPTKNLGALGDGGAVVTSNDLIAEKVAMLRQYGWSSKYVVSLAGATNSRLDEMQAAILSELLPLLDEANARRRKIAARYAGAITHPRITLPEPGGDADVAHLYVIRTQDRDGLRAHLNTRGVASDVHYPVPDHRQPMFGDRFAATKLGVTERLSQEILTLPCFPEMSLGEVALVVSAVNSWTP
jgi:dTDP-3-amino-2,3,6-trideoxy-4-keto-D-glucose/dTDP-3-amino-3,4,6-trideoxy-alpha-D-glucose/dTDP-2,6-dideoxy-D-kanosamine transaminase